MNIKTKLISISSALAIIPLITSVIILESLSTNTASKALEDAAENQLISIRDTKKTQIEDYFGAIRNQVLTFSNDRMIIDAMRQFSATFKKVTTDSDAGKSIDEMRTAVASYYSKDFGGEYKNQNAGKSIDTDRIIKQLDDESVVLQNHYIKANPTPLGNKHKLDGAENASRVIAQLASEIENASSVITEVEQANEAAEEQSAVSEEINKNITSISQISEQTASGAEQTTTSANELARLASDLQNLVSQFKINA